MATYRRLSLIFVGAKECFQIDPDDEDHIRGQLEDMMARTMGVKDGGVRQVVAMNVYHFRFLSTNFIGYILEDAEEELEHRAIQKELLKTMRANNKLIDNREPWQKDDDEDQL